MAIRRLKELSESDKACVIEAIKALLQSHEEVLFALLYGSMVDPIVQEKYGDIDVAVYIKADRLKAAEYVLEAHLEAEAYRLLSASRLVFPPVEITILNNAPYPFLLSLFRNRYIVLKENEDVMTDFIEDVSGRALANSHLRKESLREVLED